MGTVEPTQRTRLYRGLTEQTAEPTTERARRLGHGSYAADGDEETSSEIAARYLGDLGEHPDPLGIVAIIVNVPLGWELDEPEELDKPIPDESAEKQAAIVQRLENDLRAAPIIDLGPGEYGDVDRNEVIYHHPQFGSIRRTEHQLRRRLVRKRAQQESQARCQLRP